MRTIFGRYTLEREVGRGAAGSVWLANDRRLQRPVAVKLLRSDWLERPNMRARFEREALTIAQLRSPYIVHVYDTGVVDGQPFIVMEWLDGETLEDVLARRPRVPLAETVATLMHLSRALSLTHAAKIVHLDIKPANIFVTNEADDIMPKLLDFGVASWMAPQRTAAGAQPSMLGTPHYMSPEQMSAGPVDGRSDLWSVAVVAYAMLTGRLPFEADDLADLREKICREAHTPPSRYSPDLAPAVDEVFAKALAKDPRARFQNATEMAAAFLRAAQMPASAPIKILLLDDEPDMELLFRAGFRRELEEKRYELTFATDGGAGLSILRSRSDIDVVLTDINMPGMDGLTVLAHVGQIDPTLRVVMVSAYSDFTNVRAAMNHGAFDFVVKPFDGFGDLRLTIERCAHHVALLRRGVQTTRENDLLRLLVQRTSGAPRGADAASPAEGRTEGSVAFVGFDLSTPDDLRQQQQAIARELSQCLAQVCAEVSESEAPLVRPAGSAVMLVFTGERHAERAARLCMVLRERARAASSQTNGHPLGRFTMALDSGPLVMAGLAGTGGAGHHEPAVFGEAVRRAAALHLVAYNGEILVSSTLKSLLDGRFVLRPATREERPPSPDPVFALVDQVGAPSALDGVDVLSEAAAPSRLPLA